MTVLVCVGTSKQVGDRDHRRGAASSMASISSWLARALKLRAMFVNMRERFGEIPGSLALAL
jgi:hypothetical protein